MGKARKKEGTVSSFYPENEEYSNKRIQKKKKKEQFRIAMVSDFFCPNTGGVETHIYQLAKCLLNNGHKVIVITHAYGNRNGIRYLCSGKLKVYYLPCLVFGNNYLPSALGSLPWFRKIFSYEHIQIVHSHSTFSTLGHEALLHAWTFGLCTIFTDHSLYGFADAGAILSNRLVLRYSLANVDRLICVSYTSKENTVLRAKVPPSHVYVIPNAIDPKLFKPDSNLFYNSRPITIVVISRLVYRKGADLLVQIIPEVCKRHKEVRFVIGGDGPKRVELEEMRENHKLHNRVEFKGELPHDKVREVLIQGQIFLNTSLTDAFCMSIVEAACCGLHVVSTKVGGIPEVLPPEFITLSEPKPEVLIQSLLDAINLYENNLFPNPTEKNNKISELYHWNDVAIRTEKVYKAAMEEFEIGHGQQRRSISFQQIQCPFPVHKNSINWLSVVRPEMIISCSSDNTIVLNNMDNCSCITRWIGHKKEVTKVIYKHTGSQHFVLSGSKDCSVRLWRFNETKCVQTFNGHEFGITGLTAFEENFVSGARDGKLLLWNINRYDKPICSSNISNNQNIITHIELNAENQIIFQTGEDGAIRLWDSNNLTLIDTIPSSGGYQPLWHCSRLPNIEQNYLLTAGGGDGNEIKLWDIRQRKLIKRFRGHEDDVKAAIFLQPQPQITSKKLVLSVSKDRTVRLWDIDTGICIWTENSLTAELNCCADFTNGRVIVCGVNATLCEFRLLAKAGRPFLRYISHQSI